MTARAGRRARRLRGERGWISIEFVGMFALFLVTLLFVLQGAAFSYTIAQANGAARAAARASSLGESGVQAARNAVNPSLRPVVASGGPSAYVHRWQVTLRVPQVVPMMPSWSVTRTAAMPATEPFGG